MSLIKDTFRSVIPTSVWTQLRLIRLRRHVESYQRRQVKHMYGPFPLKIELVDGMSEGWYDHDWPELPEFRLMSQRYPPGWGGRIFDLGAHQGVIAILLSRYAGSQAEVIALEANSHNASAARRNVTLNGAGNCKIVHAAIAEHSGSVVFSKSLNGSVDDGSGEWGKVRVSAFSIDDLALKYGKPDLIFLDVEGYECRALAGAKHTLSTKPDVFIEVHLGKGLEKFGGCVQEILSYFSPSEYTLYFNEEHGPEFRRFESLSELPTDRFFLFALSNGSSVSAGQSSDY